MLKNYTPFGSVDIEIVTIFVWLMHLLDLGYVPPHPTPLMEVLEELRRSRAWEEVSTFGYKVVILN